MDRKRLDFNRKMPLSEANILVFKKANSKIENYIQLNTEKVNHHISNTATFRMHKGQLKGEDSKTLYNKIDQDKLPVYKYTREYFYLLLSHLDNHEKNQLNAILNIRTNDIKEITKEVECFCDKLISQISTVRNFEFGLFCLDRYSKDMLNEVHSLTLNQYKKNTSTIDEINKLVFESISESTQEFKDINEKDLALLLRVLKYKVDKDLFPAEIGFLFSQDFKTNTNYYSERFNNHKQILLSSIKNRSLKNIKVITKKDSKKNNQKGNKR